MTFHSHSGEESRLMPEGPQCLICLHMEIAELRAALKRQTEALGETLAEVMVQRDALKAELAMSEESAGLYAKAAGAASKREEAAESRASSLEGRLEAAMKVVDAARVACSAESDGQVWFHVPELRRSLAALDETGGRA